MTSIPSIPTLYQGIRMRSRLEARWAAMFGKLGWQWHYEPIELNFYIPDFLVTSGLSMGDTVVECKPFLPSERTTQTATLTKLVRSGWQGPMLLLGAVVQPDGLCGLYRAPGAAGWADAYLRWVAHEAWPMEPVSDGDGHWDVTSPEGGAALPFRLSMAWHAAGNEVQWRPSAS